MVISSARSIHNSDETGNLVRDHYFHKENNSKPEFRESPATVRIVSFSICEAGHTFPRRTSRLTRERDCDIQYRNNFRHPVPDKTLPAELSYLIDLYTRVQGRRLCGEQAVANLTAQQRRSFTTPRLDPFRRIVTILTP
jgi:hypothetical protein